MKTFSFANLARGKQPRAEETPEDEDQTVPAAEDMDEEDTSASDDQTAMDGEDADESATEGATEGYDEASFKAGRAAGRKAERVRCAAIFAAATPETVELAASLAFTTRVSTRRRAGDREEGDPGMALRESTTYDPNGILANDYPVETATVTVASGADLAAGAVVGRITASGKYILSDEAAGDGSETPVAILLTAASAASADAEAVALLSGAVAADKLVFGGSHDAGTVETAFRAAGRPLFVKTRGAA